jgi:hypothetical protein
MPRKHYYSTTVFQYKVHKDLPPSCLKVKKKYENAFAWILGVYTKL